MRKICGLLFCVLLLGACGGKQADTAAPAVAVDTIPMMVTQIQRCSKLYTSEYQLRKIITFDDTMSVGGQIFRQRFRIDLPLGKRRIAIPVTASVKAYIDFSQFSERNVRRNGDRIEIVLPDPEVTLTATQISHGDVREKVSFFRSRFSDEEVTAIQRQGRDDIIKTIPRLGIVENARQSAARQLVPIIEQLGYRPENISITFRKQFGVADIVKFIKNTES